LLGQQDSERQDVPGPFGADEKPSIAAMKIIPPDAAGPTN
jgi:hypothetical protein